MIELKEIYTKLTKKYGYQGWWPSYQKIFIYNKDNKDNILSSRQKFIICISAILTQNTSWKNVEKAITELDKFNFLNKEAIKQLNEKELGELIKSSGYYKQKAKKLKKFVEFLDSKKEVNRENLLNVWGIGKETADSILLYAYNKPFFVVDAYTRRIMERLGFKFNGYDDLQRIFINNLDRDYRLFNEFHALLVKLGKETCIKKPKCKLCPLKNICDYYKS